MTIGYGLGSAIMIYGLNAYDGGGGVTVFLYSGICSIIIWFLCVRSKISILEHKKSESYLNYTLMFIGVCMLLFSWPVFNMGGSLITIINTTIAKSAYPGSLMNSAYINTISSLGIAVISSAMLSSSLSES